MERHVGISQVTGNQSGYVLHRTIWSGSLFGPETDKSSPRIPLRKPRQPANVFFIYMKKVEPQIVRGDPGIGRKEIVSRAAAMWRELDPEEKAKIAMQRKQLYEKYKQEKKEYLENITPEQIREEEAKKQKKLAKKMKLTRRSLGMPSKPWPPFNCFLSEKFGEREDESVSTYFKILSDRWRILDESEKEKYKQISHDMKIQYLKDMDAWEGKMMEYGRYDVLRKSTLEGLKKKDKKEPKKKKKVRFADEVEEFS
ncbi:transcription factor A, mitochondrial isoform X2 [Aplysia californica]|uniref:Transcription factor A, mitochondrial n=1 Tax=Aplysia californica TaxID=6500 RepID=A0ABM1VPC5_APLCA|nr:transcription factor A, mitochondrial isoform X2 [Aplysia californica]